MLSSEEYTIRRVNEEEILFKAYTKEAYTTIRHTVLDEITTFINDESRGMKEKEYYGVLFVKCNTEMAKNDLINNL